jgi:hypothetical protein
MIETKTKEIDFSLENTENSLSVDLMSQRTS